MIIAPTSAEARPKRIDVSVQTLVLCVVVAAISFVAGVLFANSTRSRHDDKTFTMFWDSWDILEQDYYYDLPADREMVWGAIQGLYSSTGDQYTFFAPPVEAEFDRQLTAGEFGGIGAHVTQDQSGQLVILEPFPDLPAAKAGLLPGDVIVEVDGTSIEGWTLEDGVGLLRGDIGTQVEVTVYRPSEDRRLTVEITRARVELPTAYSKTYDDVGYVRLYIFNANATKALNDEIAELLEQDVSALILDLRGNPGGLLDQAVSVSDLFLGEGLVVTQRARQGKEIEYRSSDGELAESIPLVVLMDGGSASASEVVAGALKDRDRATLIGQTSYGKGSVQHVHDMPDGSQLHVTAALWFTPNDTPIQGQGLTPDIVVTVPDSLEIGQDPFIDAALDYLDKTGKES